MSDTDYCAVCQVAPCREQHMALGLVLRERHESWRPLLADIATLVLLLGMGWLILAIVVAL